MLRKDASLNAIFQVADRLEPVHLAFALNAAQANQTNEVGLFTVDDALGSIDGKVPGQAGYATAALQRAQVIFSALPRAGFDFALERRLTVEPERRFGFYLIANDTKDAILSGGGSLERVLFAHAVANSDGEEYAQVVNFSASGFTLNWDDEVGGDRDFNDLILSVQVTNQAPAPETALQGEVELIDLRTQVGQISVSAVTRSSAEYSNSFGFYVVDDTSGRIGNLNPGDPGYAQAAIQNQLDYQQGLPGGKLIAIFFIANGTAATWLAQNPSNALTDSAPVAYFPFLAANPDGIDHIRLLGDNTFAFEDLAGGGDFDYNDLVVQLSVASVPNHAPTLLQPIADQAIASGAVFDFVVAGNFGDRDGDSLQFAATQADGRDLPAWLRFDPATGRFSGTPGPGDAGTLAILVTAADGRLGQVGDRFELTVTAGGDTTPPAIASLTAADMTTSGGTSYNFTVNYADNAAIAFSSLDGGDLEVLGPGGALPAALVSATPASDSGAIAATYQINAPGGSWDAADNGSYAIQVVAGQVLDAAGNAIAGGNAGNFTVNISPPPLDYNFSNSSYNTPEGRSTGIFNGVEVVRSGNTGIASSVDILLSDNTATAGSDFTPGPITLNFAPGETSKTVPIEIVGDCIFEGDEALNLSFSSHAGTTNPTATLTLVSDEIYHTFVASNYSLPEGNTTYTTSIVEVERFGNTSLPSMFYIRPVGGTVILNSDILWPTLIPGDSIGVSFALGETRKAFPLEILGDTTLESDKTLTLQIFDDWACYAPPYPNFHEVTWLTLLNDDSPPPPAIYDFSAANYSAPEGNSSNTYSGVEVTRSGNTSLTSSVDIVLSGNTATAGSDFAPGPITLVFAIRETSKALPLTILGDTVLETDETLTLSFSSNAGTTQPTATLTLASDDAPPIYNFSAASFSVAENGATPFTSIEVLRSGDTSIASSVDVVLTGSGANPATLGVDLAAGPIALNFAPGEMVKTVPIALLDDASFEPDETVELSLTNFTAGGSAGTTQPTATLTLTNDDPALTEIRGTKWNDLNDNSARDPGEPGLAGWTIYLDTNNNGMRDTGEPTQTTDANGDYVFASLAAGTYTVAERPQRGWRQTAPGTLAGGSGTGNNILIATEPSSSTYFLYEYTPIGTQVSALNIPYGSGPYPATEYPRDLIVDRNGLIHLYNGTFSPYLSTYDSGTATWSHVNYPGWNTANNISYGGIAVYQDYVYVTDMLGSPNQGIVRFDRSSGTTQRFETAKEFIDITMGLDGWLYALRSNEDTVDTYDPETMELLWTTTLASDVRGLAVNDEGDLFGASWDNNIYHFEHDGSLLNSLNPPIAGSLMDIDVSFDGKLVVSARGEYVVLTDESLGSIAQTYNMGYYVADPFAAFADYQDPYTLINRTHTVPLAAGTVASGVDFGAVAL